jgi:adenosylcobyric acid synthase
VALAKTLMVQGTSSSVGKSLLVTALCRWFHRKGVRVAPFKAQNMSLNAYVTRDGFELGRAQVVQAFAAGLEPTVDMNPILLKPEAHARSQVIIHGRARGTHDAWSYMRGDRTELKEAVLTSLSRLREQYELVVIEGAGSPAEINLRDRDIVNMFVARAADAPVLLVGDIDRGGVFASLVGTLTLLEAEDRARVKAFIINKFRGDQALLAPGLTWLEEYTGIPVLGVLPHLGRLPIADEDSLDLDDRLHVSLERSDRKLRIAVIRLPSMSNHDEFQPLEHEVDVSLGFVHEPREASGADLVIVPGSKSTIADLAWLRASGFAQLLLERSTRHAPVLGICGGCQMLGGAIEDPQRFESPERTSQGLGLLPITTRFSADKRTERVITKPLAGGFLGAFGADFGEVPGYVIHAGRVRLSEGAGRPWLMLGDESEGVITHQALAGTMVHGLFEDTKFRQAILTALRGAAEPSSGAASSAAISPYDVLADALDSACDSALLWRLAMQHEP